ncbi:response regulator transcription factor [Lentzea sp. NPDC042327]|uniref:response regulator transcription factor n=1 Tax=Lentzea sp. NPDC042327 TaxID=3154801 RepID=UPI003403044A
MLLADHDPISRHVLAARLRTCCNRMKLIGSVDSLVPVSHWPRLTEKTVVVMSVYSREDVERTVLELSSRGIRILLLVSRVDRQSVEWALSIGATGCVVKDTEMGGLTDAVHAVAGGYLLFSPELAAHRGPMGVAPPVLLQQPNAGLTDREHEVLSLLADGMSTVEAARSLGVSPATIKSHVSHALPKLGARNRLEAVLLIRNSTRPYHPARNSRTA